MSIRLYDLSRWPIPNFGHLAPSKKVALLSPTEHVFPLMPIQLGWLERCSRAYGFDGDVGETLRHLVYVANAEPAANKKLIFRIKRCLHCHVGARAGQHAKVDLVAQVHTFQLQWLHQVADKCGIASPEKCVRIICDFYQSRVKQAGLEERGAVADADVATIIHGHDVSHLGGGVRKELELFGMRRAEDPRFLECLERLVASHDSDAVNDENRLYRQDEGGSARKSTGGKGGKMGCDLGELDAADGACSAEATLRAIERCQVGRSQQTYAAARGETAEQTRRRRAEELRVENSEEARRQRRLIGRALGNIMG